MNISFWLTSTTRFVTEDNWDNIPFGGAEISAINLGTELAKLGHGIKFYLERCEPFEKDNISIRKHHQLFDDEHEYFICVRPHPMLQGDFGNIKKILWSGDAFDQSSNDVFYDKKIADSMDGFVFKSEWQKDKILEKYYTIDKNKCSVIYNGYNAEYFNNNGVIHNSKRFIHSSVWYRGLKNFIDIWPVIIESIPDAEIHVFSNTTLYHGIQEQGYYDIIKDLIGLPGMILREPVPQKILAHEMKKSYLMLYPNSGFVESSCGSALQSMAVGTPVVTTKRAGLIETVGESGILIEQSEENWKNKFAREVISLYRDHKKWEEMVKTGLLKVSDQTWSHKAKVWEDYLKSL